MTAPVIEQARGFWCDQPLFCVLEFSPFVNVAAQFVDDRVWIVPLLFG